MCGFLYAQSRHTLSTVIRDRLISALHAQSWRGPDNTSFEFVDQDRVFLGHNRLSIIDLSDFSDQPFTSEYIKLIYNGEIYNYHDLSNLLGANTSFKSDTHFLAKSLSSEIVNDTFLSSLEGMFSFVSHNTTTGTFFGARDLFGIKPFYYYYDDEIFLASSESATIAQIISASNDSLAIKEYQLFRRPCPGYTHWKNVYELLPGHTISLGREGLYVHRYDKKLDDIYIQQTQKLEDIIKESVSIHEAADCDVVSMLSGGVDSNIVALFSQKANLFLSVGSESHNEFDSAKVSASILDLPFVQLTLDQTKCEKIWHELFLIKREPLSVPNESLIYYLCSSLSRSQKVVLTGEGSDEIFFGYSNILNLLLTNQITSKLEFFQRYCYGTLASITDLSDRFLQWDSTNGEDFSYAYVRSFFLNFHLPCLLRRMDFASMAAGKESRTPFLHRKILSFANNLGFSELTRERSKEDLRRILDENCLGHISRESKFAFSANFSKLDRLNHYSHFRSFFPI